MPRPERIQYENAFYHVMNRGRGRQTVFHNDNYYQAFLDTLAEAHTRFDASIHAYCLMKNHYHLLIETPNANLDRIMRHINGVYTQRYNRLMHTDGPLFRGRYKSIIVDKDAYLLQLSRYIHRNPIEVAGTEKIILEYYPWSSYPAYINKAKPEPWLARELTYQMLDQHYRYAGYKRYVEAGIDDDIKYFYNKGNLAAILGDTDFKEHLIEIKNEADGIVEQIVRMSEKPTPDAIVKAVAMEFKVNIENIKQKQQGLRMVNTARQVAIYCCQELGGMTRKEIARHFSFAHPGSASLPIKTVKRELTNGKIKEMDGIYKRLDMVKPA